ncbi:MAG TPA: hypothetical protein VK550_24080 [Polyangiaceae bacterium]|nr:hypothetical protein [Polyangiaceae bacterium]
MIGRRSLGSYFNWRAPTAIVATPVSPAPAPQPAAITTSPAPHIVERVKARSKAPMRRNRPSTIEDLARIAGVTLPTAIAWRDGWGPISPRCRRGLDRAAQQGGE